MASSHYDHYIDNMNKIELKLFNQINSCDWFLNLSYQDKVIYTKKYINIYLESYYKLPSITDILDSHMANDQKRLILDKYKSILSDDKLGDEFNNNINYIIKHYDEYLLSLFIYFINTNKRKIEDNDDDNLQQVKHIKIIEPEKTASDILLSKINNSLFNHEIKEFIKHKSQFITNYSLTDKYYRWVDFVLKIPNNSKEILKNRTIEELIIDFYIKINNEAFGLKDIKEEIICSVMDLIFESEASHQSIGLIGPPGIGKTMIITCLSKILDIPMIKISLGGIADSSFLLGHEFTYASSEPGIIARSLARVGTKRCIIYFDELDKVSKSDKGKEVINALMPIIDFTQNYSFHDTYVGDIPIDLSKVIFFFSLNDASELDPVLMSRISLIKTEGYSISEKISIVQKYMFPSFLKNNKIDTKDLILTEDVIKYIFNKIQNISNGEKKGLREVTFILNKIIKRFKLYSIVDKIPSEKNIKQEITFNIPNFSIPYTITINLVDQLLKNNELSREYETHYKMYT